ncbi:ATP-binding protein [Sphingomonas solaris]|uniref:histidine kinase n=1 Tax=Alterirhizorhabdus solaris TaxID=2529389 RepID=A0A558QXY0_9SPHN|nr:ATP-binding protein [Sphingomonas solaris]TVV72014.1 HAMP domain-containing protein [Sphingomonas solaris]
MRRLARPSIGLLGRVFAILLLTIVIEFAASTLLYERASSFSVREDEARRLAEHLVIARRLVSERPWRERPAMARRLSTDRYLVRWAAALPAPPPVAPGLNEMQRQVTAWEPSLGDAGLRLRLTSPGREGIVTGGLPLGDGSWLLFRTAEHIHEWDLAIGRIVLALVPAFALIVLGGLLVRRTLRPMGRLALAAGRVGLGGTATVEEAGPGEVRRVIRAFNAMQERIHRLIGDRTQALAAVGHDMRTPLARLQLRADEIAEPTLRDAMLGDVAEMEAMIGSLLAYLGGEEDPETPVRIDIAVLAATIVDDAQDRGGDAAYEGPDHVELVVRPVAIKRALANLVENGLHYGDRVTVTVVEAADHVRLCVDDDGPGIPEADLPRVTEPFIRLDPARGRNTQGLGLGLAIVRRTVALEGGTLRLVNRPTGGLRAEIVLPLEPASFVQ